MKAIGRFLDGGAWCVPGEEPAPSRGRADEVLVFLLIDGLGDEFLRRHGVGSALLGHRARRITSVFPSTTASAVTTVLTGMAPGAHGLTGWHVSDRRFGGVVMPLPMRRRAGGRMQAPYAAERLFPYPTLFQRRRRSSSFLLPHSLAQSPYSRRHGRGASIHSYRGLASMVEAILAEAEKLRAAGGGYLHAYYAVFDALSHTYGCESREVLSEFERLDGAFSTLMRRLAGSGVRLVVSADHGFIDAPEARLIRLERHPEAKAMLAGPLSGERRAAYCEVRPGAEREFVAFGREVLPGRAVLRPSGDLVAAGLFGPGPMHRRLRERVGSHVLLMEPGWTIMDRLPGERPHRMIGVHGGLSPQEMWVPLICARC